MRFRYLALSLILGSAALSSTAGQTQDPLIDAGGQAMIMHQGDLLEQQTAPNNDSPTPSKRVSRATSTGCSLARDRERLRPEYERRVRAEGRQAANAWLQQEATALGRQAGARAKAGVQC